MKYRELIQVNEKFQYSVNLQFDIYNISKIKEYIPTEDGCEILKFYIDSILNGKNRSSTLIGPYGKGKSHLLLVLITLLSDYKKENQKDINQLILKIKNIDQELFKMLKEIQEKKVRLMPIIINSNYDDINQSFLLGLAEALERENVIDVNLHTSFDTALDVIEVWEREYAELLLDVSTCLEKYNCVLKDLKQGLLSYSRKSYQIFKEVYKCISKGQIFNPLVNADLIKIYKDITYEICNRGYTGIFIVFDEFSKFLESIYDHQIMKDLKILQDFAELASRTDALGQIHLSLITHKSLQEYLKTFGQIKSNSFKTVEGRFKNIYFNRSMEQNYEIISHALKKDKSFTPYFDHYYLENKKKYDMISKLDIFKNINHIEKNLFKGCFPLNPLTTYALIELSEKIAQNERTLFTFLADNDINGLKYFIENNNKGLFLVDKIYDYFSSLLRKETDETIKDIWFKSENALRKDISFNSKKIIKTMSVILMIHNLDEFTTTENIIQLSTDLSSKEYQKARDELIEKSIIRKKKITEELDFATMYNGKLTKEVKDLVEYKFLKIDEKKILNDIVGVWYSLPRRYNENYKITRFFINLFMTEDEILHISNFDLLFEEYYCDGIIIHLIKTSNTIYNVIKHFKEIKDDKVILRIPKITFSNSFSNSIREYEAIKYLKNEYKQISDLDDELNMMQAELIEAIQETAKDYISEENAKTYVYLDTEEENIKYVSSLLSDICESIYHKTPIINNELINKKELSSPIKRARNIVIDCILNDNKSFIKSPTSAEATIYKATAEKREVPSVKYVLEVIKKFIESSDQQKQNFNVLYKRLESKPFAMRKGIIPILVSMALRDYSDHIILYYMNREIDLDSSNLIKINENPEKYFILTEQGTAEKMNYIHKLMDIFNVKCSKDTLRMNIQTLIIAMKRWMLSLPRLIKETTILNSRNLKEEYILIKEELLKPDTNNNELLFKTMPELFRGYSNVIIEVKQMKKTYDEYLDHYYEILIQATKDTIKNNYKGSLTTLLKEWYNEIKDTVKRRIFDLKAKEFINYISSLDSHDEKTIINKLAKIITDFYIEDWQPVEFDHFISEINRLKEKFKITQKEEEYSQKIVLVNQDSIIEKNLSQDSQISALGHTMKNNLETILDEYGSSINEQEKINILLEIIKKYI